MPFKSAGIDRKCKWCPMPPRKNFSNGIFKGYLRTCGSIECKQASYKDKAINQTKRFHADRVCESCSSKYEAISVTQRWCKQCSPDRKSSALLQRYNLSANQVQVLLINCNGVCKICLSRKAKVVDHDHRTGQVRGIICGACNVALHTIENNEVLSRARMYLKGVL